MIKNKYVAFIIYVVVFLALWNVLDLLYTTLITKSAYQFAAGSDLAIPAVGAAVTGYLFFLRGGSN